MSEKDYVKYQIRNIPIKLLISIVVAWFTFSNSKGGVSNLFGTIAVGICLYGLMTCLSAFAKAVNNWFLGIILFGILAVILGTQVLPEIVNILLVIILLFGGIVRDIYRIIKLIRITVKEKENTNFSSWDNSAAPGTDNELNHVIESYNHILGIVQNNFNNLSLILRENQIEQDRYEQLIEEYNAILDRSEEIYGKLQSQNELSADKVTVLTSLFKQCYDNMQGLYNKQQVFLEDVSKQIGANKSVFTSAEQNVPEYFAGCDSKDSLTKRYRELCKVYHPDMGNGSSEVFNKIQNEYNELKMRYK